MIGVLEKLKIKKISHKEPSQIFKLYSMRPQMLMKLIILNTLHLMKVSKPNNECF